MHRLKFPGLGPAAAFLILFVTASLPALTADEMGMLLLDNARVDARKITVGPSQPTIVHAVRDSVLVGLKNGEVTLLLKGELKSLSPSEDRGVILVEFKEDKPAPLMANTSGLPNAFPRPGGKKIASNARTTVWDYTWQPGSATQLHFHPTDTVAVFLADGALKSTTRDGTVTIKDHSYGLVTFNLAARVHTEELARGAARAILIELN